MATNLRVNFIGKNELSKTTAVISRDFKKLGNTAKSVGNSINKSLGAVGVGLGLAALTNTMKTAVVGFEKAQIASKKLDTVLTSMGFGSYTKRVDDYAESLQNQVYVDADVIKSAQTKLATFSELTKSVGVAGGAFDRATVASLDLAAVFGGDASSQAVALGKALQDPIKGITALSRQGVTFTAQEKAKIKTLVETNRTLEAQDMILSTIEKQVGGTAKAGASEFTKLQLIFDSMLDTIGEALLPAVKEFSTYLASAEGEKNVKKIVDAFVFLGHVISGIVSFMLQNVSLVIGMGVQVLIVKAYFVALNVVIKLMESGIIKATTAIKLMKYALISSGIGAAIALVGTLASMWIEATEAKEGYDSSSDVLDENGNYSAPIGPGLGPKGETWLTQGYESFEAYLADIKAKKEKLVKEAEDLADQIKKALASKIEGMKKTGEKFRDAVSVAFGLFGEDEYAVFNVDYFKGKLQRMVSAAKGFATNLKQILKTPGSQPLVDELIGMGPVEGNIAAKALLASGDLKEIVGLKASLYQTGTQAGAVQAVAGNATYEININKAVISASDIIKEIRILEKKSGRKYLVGS
jgi:hypothetical protein